MLKIAFEGLEVKDLLEQEVYTNLDPYVVYALDGKRLFRTCTKYKAQRSAWDFSKESDVSEIMSPSWLTFPKGELPSISLHPEELHKKLSVEVWDEDKLAGKDLLGRWEIKVQHLVTNAFANERVDRVERMWHRDENQVTGMLSVRFKLDLLLFVQHLLCCDDSVQLFQIIAKFYHFNDPRSPIRYLLTDQANFEALLRASASESIHPDDRVYVWRAIKYALQGFPAPAAQKLRGLLLQQGGELFRRLGQLRVTPPVPSFAKHVVILELSQYITQLLASMQPPKPLARSMVQGGAVLRDVLPRFVEEFAGKREALVEQVSGAQDKAERERAWAQFVRTGVLTMSWFIRLCVYCSMDSQCTGPRMRSIVGHHASELQAISQYLVDSAVGAASAGVLDGRTKQEVLTVAQVFRRLW